VLIVLSPLPFGCVGEVWRPLFFLCILLISVQAVRYALLNVDFVLYKQIRLFSTLFMGFLIFQLIPWPIFLLKLFSPNTVRILKSMHTEIPFFHSISLVPIETMKYLFYVCALAVFFYGFIHISLKRREMYSLINTMVISAVFQVILAFLKYTQGNEKFYLFFHTVKEHLREPNRLYGTLANADHFAFYLQIIFPLIIGLIFAESYFFSSEESLREKITQLLFERRSTIYYLLAAVIVGAGIVLTGSRAGLMTLTVSFVLLMVGTVFLRKPSRIRKKLQILFAVIAVFVIIFGLQNTISNLSRPDIIENIRLTYWNDSLGIFSDFPLFGSGFGTFKYVYYMYDSVNQGWLMHAHNEYVEGLADGGGLGMLLSVLPLLFIFISLITIWKSRRHPVAKALGLAVIVVFIGASLHSFFDFSFRIPAISFLFVLILGIGIKMVSYKREM
jgi:O-antigen ligase